MWGVKHYITIVFHLNKRKEVLKQTLKKKKSGMNCSSVECSESHSKINKCYELAIDRIMALNCETGICCFFLLLFFLPRALEISLVPPQK